MLTSKKSKEIWEFGDFQTPDSLAMQVADILQYLKINPASVIEPTCGKGNLLISTIKAYPHAKRYIGADINSTYLRQLKERLSNEELNVDIDILHTDFFETNWDDTIASLPQPILIVGNPPWVTSSELSQLQSSNLPEKSNFRGRNGLEALTGKSNFDISEWMLLQHLSWLQNRTGMVAMLCKTAVARKILIYAWQKSMCINLAQIHKIDAKKYFNAAVDACLLLIQFGEQTMSQKCSVFESITDRQSCTTWGYRDGLILSDVKKYQRLCHLKGEDRNYTWRSGIKHDCAKVMELSRNDHHFINGDGIACHLEENYIYPLLKSSDVGNNRMTGRRKYMLVTQRYIGEDTNKIRDTAPKTWNYLQNNKEILARRGSSIYKNRPNFSIFGVGDYTFSPWKVAISGFYKRLHFVAVPPIDDKPVVFDDTVYFLSCQSEAEARFVLGLLNSSEAQDFLISMIFWEDKRPITIELLKKLNLYSLSVALNKESEYFDIVKQRGLPNYSSQVTQLRLLDEGGKYNS